MTLPESPTQTRYCSAAYGLPDNRRATRLTRYLNERINMRTEAEDESFVSWLQEGLNSSAFPEIKLSAIESGVRDFHKRIQGILPMANLKHAPPAGEIAETNRRF